MLRIKSLATVALAVAGLTICTDTAQGQSLKDRVIVHGFLSQAYADATDMPIFGIPTGGTADLRAAALQLRLAATRRDNLVVQFSHRRLGGSLLATLEETMELDWAYYSHRFGAVSARVGRFPMPRGLFNEIRDVGTLLPFYRASKAFYSSGVETVDGARVDYEFAIGGWEIESVGFYGDFDLKVQFTGSDGLVVVNSAWEKSFGGQVVVNTPVQGVRFGFTGLRADPDDSEPAYIWTGSADASFERFFVRGEYELAHVKNSTDYEAYYGQAGVRVLSGLWLNGQAEWNTNTILSPGPAFGAEIKAIRDYALGVSYAVNSHLVLKVEGHSFKGYEFDVPVNPFGAPMGNKYFITSVSTAF